MASDLQASLSHRLRLPDFDFREGVHVAKKQSSFDTCSRVIWPLQPRIFFMARMPAGIGPFPGAILLAPGEESGLIGSGMTIWRGRRRVNDGGCGRARRCDRAKMFHLIAMRMAEGHWLLLPTSLLPLPLRGVIAAYFISNWDSAIFPILGDLAVGSIAVWIGFSSILRIAGQPYRDAADAVIGASA